uniref:Uncharacterized protein n=1 Tax=Meloidogyne incognita TaxID=6306 RepID=A0A914KQL1_MELIC
MKDACVLRQNIQLGMKTNRKESLLYCRTILNYILNETNAETQSFVHYVDLQKYRM